jgi:hypothetical protein
VFDLSNVDAKDGVKEVMSYGPLPTGEYPVKINKVETDKFAGKPDYGSGEPRNNGQFTIVKVDAQVLSGEHKSRYFKLELWLGYPKEFNNKGNSNDEAVAKELAKLKRLAEAVGFVDLQTASDAQKLKVESGQLTPLPQPFDPAVLAGKTCNVKISHRGTDTNKKSGKEYHSYWFNDAAPLADDSPLAASPATSSAPASSNDFQPPF